MAPKKEETENDNKSDHVKKSKSQEKCELDAPGDKRGRGSGPGDEESDRKSHFLEAAGSGPHG